MMRLFLKEVRSAKTIFW